MRHGSKGIREIVNIILARQPTVTAGELALAAKITRQAAHRHLAALVESGILLREGKGRGSRYRPTPPGLEARFSYALKGLDEDAVWKEVRARVPRLNKMADNVERIVHYALTEFVKNLADLVARYAKDYEFSKTRVVVKLFEIGVRFVSRSEAKRVLHGLDRFKEVVLDFKGVQDVGQGFADEVFRVWPATHPGVAILPENMVPAVEFMVKRARRA